MGSIEGYVPRVGVLVDDIDIKGGRGSIYIGTLISIARFSAAAIATRAP